jgi:hypothetical protein
MWAVIGHNFDKFRRTGIILNYIKKIEFLPHREQSPSFIIGDTLFM